MRHRFRPDCNFTPGRTSLEKLAGASSFALGELAIVAYAMDDTLTGAEPDESPAPSEGRRDIGRTGRPLTTRTTPPSKAVLPLKMAAEPLTNRAGASFPDDGSFRPGPTAPGLSLGGLIRPLSLAPRAQAVAPPQPPRAHPNGDGIDSQAQAGQPGGTVSPPMAQADTPQTLAVGPQSFAPDSPLAFTSGSEASGGGTSGGGSGGIDHTDWKVFVSGGTMNFSPDNYYGGGLVNGKHPENPNPAPLVVQGTRWSGGVMLYANTDTSQYSLLNYTWTFPFGAVKGYGRFSQREERPGAADPVKYWRFDGDPTESSAISEETNPEVKFTDDDKSYQSSLAANPNAENGDHVLDSFYWGPYATDEQTVFVTATYVKRDPNGNVVDTFTDDDSVTFRVIRPSGSATVDSMGTSGVTPPGDAPQWVQIDVNRNRADPNDPNRGIKYHTTVNPPGDFGGVFANTQTMRFHVFSFGKNVNNVAEIWQDGIFFDSTGKPVKEAGTIKSASNTNVVDEKWYPGRINDPNVGDRASQLVPFATVGDRLHGIDSPGMEARGFSFRTETFSRYDDFEVTVMYNPNPSPSPFEGEGPGMSIWIPVGLFTWKWGDGADYKGNIWVQSAVRTRVQTSTPYKEIKLFPNWEKSITEVRDNWLKL